MEYLSLSELTETADGTEKQPSTFAALKRMIANTPPDSRCSSRRHSPCATSDDLLARPATPDPNGGTLDSVLSFNHVKDLFY